MSIFLRWPLELIISIAWPLCGCARARNDCGRDRVGGGELAIVGGSWFPERTRPTLGVVSNRHRDVARVVLAALERLEAAEQEAAALNSAIAGNSDRGRLSTSAHGDHLSVGATVVYRPRAIIVRSLAKSRKPGMATSIWFRASAQR
jgi:hypothetical protein